mmetsp:Transcript_7319/g.18784  ORF Transcript_7319/g.18784 Transcript_7319/m.18784 type:complete len:294 (-) Transcript_7319:69-950(-)
MKWFILQAVVQVPELQRSRSAKRWLKNGRVKYSWYRRFLARHPELRERVVDNRDPKRWKVSVADIKSLYDILERYRQAYPGLTPAYIANLDETGLTPERRKKRCLAAKGARRTHALINDQRFSMTVLPCIFADGTSMPPHFIVRGKKRPHWWSSDKHVEKKHGTAFQHSGCSAQENAWMTTEIFLTWFTERFLPWNDTHRSRAQRVDRDLHEVQHHQRFLKSWSWSGRSLSTSALSKTSEEERTIRRAKAELRANQKWMKQELSEAATAMRAARRLRAWPWTSLGKLPTLRRR